MFHGRQSCRWHASHWPAIKRNESWCVIEALLTIYNQQCCMHGSGLWGSDSHVSMATRRKTPLLYELLYLCKLYMGCWFHQQVHLFCITPEPASTCSALPMICTQAEWDGP